MLKYRVDIQPAIEKKPLVDPLRVATYCRVSTEKEARLSADDEGLKEWQNLFDLSVHQASAHAENLHAGFSEW